jgi:hypothetical protein
MSDCFSDGWVVSVFCLLRLNCHQTHRVIAMIRTPPELTPMIAISAFVSGIVELVVGVLDIVSHAGCEPFK